MKHILVHAFKYIKFFISITLKKPWACLWAQLIAEQFIDHKQGGLAVLDFCTSGQQKHTN